MRKDRFNNYDNFEYSEEARAFLDSITITENDMKKLEECYTNYLENGERGINKCIIEQVFKLAYIKKVHINDICNIYDVSIRMVQIWLKVLGIPRTSKDRKSIIEYGINKNQQKYRCYGDKEFIDKDYCLYRMLDSEDRVLYLGKCKKTKHKNASDYFLKERLTLHYANSSKQNPKSLYLNVRKIEVCFPNVNNNDDLEKIESQLISYYEREKLQCNYCRDIKYGYEYIHQDDMKWEIYCEKTDKDIEILLKKYKMEEIPPIEITNERLKAIMWTINKLN